MSSPKRKRDDPAPSTMPFNQAPAAVRAAFTVSHLPSPSPPLPPPRLAAVAAAPRTKAKKPKIDHAPQEENATTVRTDAIAATQQHQQEPIQQTSRQSPVAPQLLPPPPPPVVAPVAPAMRKSSRRTTKKPKRKTMTSKGKRAVILNVLASVEAQKFTTTAPVVVAQPPPPTTTVTSTRPVPAPPTPETCNIGKSWTKEDLAKLTRLVEDSAYLHELIPDHPTISTATTTSTTRVTEMDWELISKSFGRYSKGGTAVKHQYYAVLRVLKQARREGRTAGSNYIDLVQKALMELPESSGTVYDIQAVLKKKYSKHLDKYKVKGQVRWKRAVGECLREEESLFEAVGKTETGKIMWKLVG